MCKRVDRGKQPRTSAGVCGEEEKESNGTGWGDETYMTKPQVPSSSSWTLPALSGMVHHPIRGTQLNIPIVNPTEKAHSNLKEKCHSHIQPAPKLHSFTSSRLQHPRSPLRPLSKTPPFPHRPFDISIRASVLPLPRRPNRHAGRTAGLDSTGVKGSPHPSRKTEQESVSSLSVIVTCIG